MARFILTLEFAERKKNWRIKGLNIALTLRQDVPLIAKPFYTRSMLRHREKNNVCTRGSNPISLIARGINCRVLLENHGGRRSGKRRRDVSTPFSLASSSPGSSFLPSFPPSLSCLSPYIFSLLIPSFILRPIYLPRPSLCYAIMLQS